jgi:hypothetical protein
LDGEKVTNEGAESDCALEPEEEKVFNLLSEAYNRFIQLRLYPGDLAEFTEAIRQAQNIVTRRPRKLRIVRMRDE